MLYRIENIMEQYQIEHYGKDLDGFNFSVIASKLNRSFDSYSEYLKTFDETKKYILTYIIKTDLGICVYDPDDETYDFSQNILKGKFNYESSVKIITTDEDGSTSEKIKTYKFNLVKYVKTSEELKTFHINCFDNNDSIVTIEQRNYLNIMMPMAHDHDDNHCSRCDESFTEADGNAAFDWWKTQMQLRFSANNKPDGEFKQFMAWMASFWVHERPIFAIYVPDANSIFIEHFAKEIVGCKRLNGFDEISGKFNEVLEGTRLLMVDRPKSMTTKQYGKLTSAITAANIPKKKLGYPINNRCRVIITTGYDALKAEDNPDEYLLLSNMNMDVEKKVAIRLSESSCMIAWGLKKYAEENREEIIRLIMMPAVKTEQLQKRQISTRKKSVEFFVEFAKSGKMLNFSCTEMADEYNRYADTKYTNRSISRFFKDDFSIDICTKSITHEGKRSARFYFTTAELCSILWKTGLVDDSDDLPFQKNGKSPSMDIASLLKENVELREEVAYLKIKLAKMVKKDV